MTVINPADRKVITKIHFEIPGITKEAIQPVGVRITQDGKIAFVALGPANRVAVIDTTTFEVLKYLLVGQRVWQMAFTPDGKKLVDHQRRLERRVGHRRCHHEGDQVDPKSAAIPGASSSRR